MYLSSEAEKSSERLNVERTRTKRTGRVILSVILVCVLVGAVATVSLNSVGGTESKGPAGLLVKKTAKQALFAGETESESRARLRKELIAHNENPELVDDLIADLRLAQKSKRIETRPNAQVSVIHGQWSPNYGGHGGAPFHYDLPSGAHYIKVICVFYGWVVNHFSFRWDNNVVHDVGGNHSGHFGCFTAPANGCISQVDVRSGALVDAMKFYSTTFRSAQSPRFGGGGGGESIAVGLGNCLVGVKGRVGAHLDQISFKFM